MIREHRFGLHTDYVAHLIVNDGTENIISEGQSDEKNNADNFGLSFVAVILSSPEPRCG